MRKMGALFAVAGMVAMLSAAKTAPRGLTQPTTQEIQDSVIVEEWKKTIIEKKQPFDMHLLTDSAKVLIFGENPETGFQSDFLASHMQEFYDRGYSCLCLEMPSDLQEKLHFMRMIVKLRKDGAEVSQGEEMFLNFLRSQHPEETAKSMYGLIDAAYSTGMEVYAIDLPSTETPEPYNYPEWIVGRREEYMSNVVQGLLRTGEKPILVGRAMDYKLAFLIQDARFITFSSLDSSDPFYRAIDGLGIDDSIMINDGKYTIIYIPEK